ncbi:hypothetical protein L1987_61083 [Smallanthus sonchifolius]|uniref:Uncharacterized protein n=1 Tax=Smallanthus sonchifolius TaxID=185202 RepID=A0ACB9DA63_9ASTR|nr:hypothetical protein L1987_61083 [Smallanthus sonchifolius]
MFGNSQRAFNAYQANDQFAADIDRFNDSLRSLIMNELIGDAAAGGLLKFASGTKNGPDSITIYALVQCTPDQSEEQCRNCFDALITMYPNFHHGYYNSFNVHLYDIKEEKKAKEPPTSESIQIEAAEAFQYNFSTVKEATNDFSEENKLGQGGFGAVYKV